MYVVAVTEQSGDTETEAYALAPLLGLSPYDVRLRLSSVMPRIVFSSADRDAALTVLAGIRARGLGAIACDTSTMNRPGELTKVHRFTWDAEVLTANGPGSPALPWDDIAVVVLVQARQDVLREKKEIDMEFHGRRAERVEKIETHHETTLELSAYLFRRKGDDAQPRPPWILHEREAQYLALGHRMQAVRRSNFNVTIALVREHARQALFDDRFVKSPINTTDFVHVMGSDEPRTFIAPRGVEVQATLLALWLERSRGGPYRGA